MSYRRGPKNCIRCGDPIDRPLLTAKICTSCEVPAQQEYERRKKAGSIPPAVRRAVIERDRMFCRYCRIPVRPRYDRRDFGNDTMELDHVIPFRDGGEHTMDNLVVSCFRCNRKKEGRDAKARRLEAA